MGSRLIACSHPYVIPKTTPVIEEVPGRLKETGQRLHFECGECGERAFFENLNHLTAEEYNRKRADMLWRRSVLE
jgi:hypothetical protein